MPWPLGVGVCVTHDAPFEVRFVPRVILVIRFAFVAFTLGSLVIFVSLLNISLVAGIFGMKRDLDGRVLRCVGALWFLAGLFCFLAGLFCFVVGLFFPWGGLFDPLAGLFSTLLLLLQERLVARDCVILLTSFPLPLAKRVRLTSISAASLGVAIVSCKNWFGVRGRRVIITHEQCPYKMVLRNGD